MLHYCSVWACGLATTKKLACSRTTSTRRRSPILLNLNELQPVAIAERSNSLDQLCRKLKISRSAQPVLTEALSASKRPTPRCIGFACRRHATLERSPPSQPYKITDVTFSLAHRSCGSRTVRRVSCSQRSTGRGSLDCNARTTAHTGCIPGPAQSSFRSPMP